MDYISSDYKGSLCQIKTIGNVPLVSGVLSEIDQNIITITSNSGNLVPLPFEKTVKISLFNKSLGFRVLVGSVYLSTTQLLKLSDIETLSDYERRDFFRVDIIETGFILPYPLPKDLSSFVPLPCTLFDISLSGTLIQMDDPWDGMSIGSEFIIRTHLNNITFQLPIQIVRIDFSGKSGCIFSNISNMESDLLYRYIVQRQGEIIRTGRMLSGNI